MNKTFNITTFGCQMNEHDSEIIAGMLEEKGYIQSKTKEEANIVILNTCSVRDNADQRFFGNLGAFKKRKKKDPEFTICVCGCMMQQQHVVDTLKEKYPWVDLVFGTHNISDFPKLLDRTLDEKKRIIDIRPDMEEIVEGLPAKRLYEHKALVNIMYGCNNFCTYCIVPYTRGREKSRKASEIVREIENLVQRGTKEIMILGQNVNSYKDEDITFPELIKMINDIDGLERLRFMTSHPKDLSDELIECYETCDKLCNNIHLPVQSGSNEILKRMNRRYTREDYLEIAKKLKEKIPEITISTDIIVGFPGETEKDFEETLNLVKEVEYDSAFTFLYSIRNGTPAAKFEDQVEENIKHERFNRLVDEINDISSKKNLKYEGKIEKVLVESVSKNNEEFLSGRTNGYKLVNFKGPKELIGKIVDVKILKGKTFSLDGILVDENDRI